VASVTLMGIMFKDSSFNGNLTDWSVVGVTACPAFCSAGGSICGVPNFDNCASSCQSATVQTANGNTACECPAGEELASSADTVCGKYTNTQIHEWSNKERHERGKKQRHEQASKQTKAQASNQTKIQASKQTIYKSSCSWLRDGVGDDKCQREHHASS
jgi:hypothetical protein